MTTTATKATLNNEDTSMAENVIIVDADYVDRVAFDLIVNFERMLGRRIPPADMARWADCVALDGGVRPGTALTLVALLHDKGTTALDNFLPSHLSNELHGKAFSDNLGEFAISCHPIECLTSKEQFVADAVAQALSLSSVQRIMVVANEESQQLLRHTLRHAPDNKRITLFAMQPAAGGNYRQELLGYSLMAALGISAEEIDKHT